MIEALILAALLAGAEPGDVTPPDAAPPAPTTTQTPANSGRAPDENVTVTPDTDNVRHCRRAPPEVGTMIGRRICSTPREDRERAERDQAQLDRVQSLQNRMTIDDDQRDLRVNRNAGQTIGRGN